MREPRARAAPGRARAALLGGAQGRDRRGPRAPLDARLHARRSPPTTSSRCPACSRSARCSPTASWAAPARGRSPCRASASARSPARSSGCAGSRAARCSWPRLAFVGASCQPAIIALAGSTAAIAAFQARRRRRRLDRLHAVGDDAGAADPRPRAVTRDVARLVHHRRASCRSATPSPARSPTRSACTRRWSARPSSRSRCSSPPSPCARCDAAPGGPAGRSGVHRLVGLGLDLLRDLLLVDLDVVLGPPGARRGCAPARRRRRP